MTEESTPLIDKRSTKQETNHDISWLKLFWGTSKDWTVYVGLICAVLRGLLYPLLCILIGQQAGYFIEVDQFENNSNVTVSNGVTNSFMHRGIVLSVCQAVLCFFQHLLPNLCALSHIQNLQNTCVSNMLRKPILDMEQYKSGELTAFTHQSLNKIHEASQHITDAVYIISLNLIGFGFCFILNWHVALSMIYLIPSFLILRKISGKYLSKYLKQEHQYSLEANGLLQEWFNSISTVLAMNCQQDLMEQYKGCISKEADGSQNNYLFIKLHEGFKEFLNLSAYAVCFWVGAQYADTTEERGNIYALLLIVNSATQNLYRISDIRHKLLAAETAFGPLQKFLIQESHTENNGDLLQIQGAISCKNVNFTFPSRPLQMILNDVSFKFNSGKHVAIVGNSGNGKSTLFSVLLQLYKHDYGKIEFDGKSVSDLDISNLRTQTAYVCQESPLFNLSVCENISLGKPGATTDEVIEACKAACAWNFIQDLPEGLETCVGADGGLLSGGQRQRIAIARALIRKPKLLLLDESTSALDRRTESRVLKSIRQFCHESTIVTVSHRIKIAENSDYVIVLQSGKVIEQGKPGELVHNSNGEFSKLVEQEGIQNDSRRIERSYSKQKESNEQIGKQDSTPTKQLKGQISYLLALLKVDNTRMAFFIVGIGFAFIYTATFPFEAFLLASALSNFKYSNEIMQTQMSTFAIGTLLLGVIGTFISKFAKSSIIKMKTTLLNALFNVTLDFYDLAHNSASILSYRLNADVGKIQKLVSETSIIVGSLCLGTLSCWILAVIISPGYGLCMLALAPVKQISHVILIYLRLALHRKLLPLEERSLNMLSDMLNNTKTLRAFALESVLYEKFTTLVEPVEKEKIHHEYIEATIYAIRNSWDFLLTIAGYSIGAVFIDGISTTEMWIVFFLHVKANYKLSLLTWWFGDFIISLTSIPLVTRTFAEASHMQLADGWKQPDLTGAVHIENLSFTYQSRPESQALENISFSIPANQHVTLVGQSGSGKSTVAKLLQRLYTNYTGRITIDGVDIREIDSSYLRSHVVSVSQEPVLFNATISQNILLGIQDDVSFDDIINAARKANIHEFIMTLPQGYSTMVGEKGTKLSGGQKQRISIARALVREPAVIILDEPTSALDTQNEQAVLKALANAQQSCSCLLITHRLGSMQSGSKIIKMRHGNIVDTSDDSQDSTESTV